MRDSNNIHRAGLLVGGLILAMAFARSPVARADAYHWGGELERLRVDVELHGFNDGAGVGGWELKSARRFAAWAKLANTFIPRGARVVVSGPDDTSDALHLEIHESTGTLATLEMSVNDLQTDAEWHVLIGELYKHWPQSGQFPPILPTPPTLFTIQLAATSNRDSATALAKKLASRNLAVHHQFFYQVCLPCTTSPAQVITHETDSGTLYRIIVGVFATRKTARRALENIEQQAGLRGMVRSLNAS